MQRRIHNVSMWGAGIQYRAKTYITHTTLPFHLSALRTFSWGQQFFFVFLLFTLVTGFLFSPLFAIQCLVGIISILYFVDTIFNLVIILRSLNKVNEISIATDDLDSLSDRQLPVYSILCPLYKEIHVIPQFIDAISKLDYPNDKLDVLLLLEEDDRESITTVERMSLPDYFRIVIVPESLPKTKPKACNYGLSFVRGEYLVIYDAEDIPDPLQLKKAYLGFKKVSSEVVCLQAKLNYYNIRQNLLTRFFTAEYSLWFDLTLTGIQSFHSTIPLGGTSNHFRTHVLRNLEGWDPFNVTEDADLGIRLFKKGYKTEIIDSTTYEEATSTVKDWVRQRSRWIKGYMQTYLVHMRNWKFFIKEYGFLHHSIFQLTVGGKLLFLLLNPLLWFITLGYFFAYPLFGPTIKAIYQPPVSYIAVFSWIFGNFLFLYYYMLGCARRNQWDLLKYVYLIPFYWGIMSYAAIVAFYQLLAKPYYWEKTTHGRHLLSKETKEPKVLSVWQPAYAIFQKTRETLIFGKIRFFDFLKFKYSGTLSIPSLPKFSKFIKHDIWETSFLVVLQNNLRSVYGLFQKDTFTKTTQGLNILIFNWRDTKHHYAGGAEVYIYELAKRFVKDGNQVTLFCGNDTKNLANEQIDGMKIIRRGGFYTVYLLAFFYYILKFRGRYDVIVDCENGIPFFTPLFTKIPVILLIHHVHQEVFRKFLPIPWKQLAGFLEGKVMPYIYRNKTIVTVSESSKKEILQLGFTKEELIEVIYNGVSKTTTTPPSKTPQPSFVYLGRLKAYKNIDIAIKAFATFIKDYPQAVLSIVGDGEYKNTLQQLVEKLQITNNVVFFGKVSEKEKTRLLSQSWAMIQPSQVEGWGITVIEANAVGTPVIASDVNGLKDSVIDGKTGILVPVKHIYELTVAMKKIVHDIPFRTLLSLNAYVWSRRFDWNKSAMDFYTVIARSLDGESSQRLFRNVSFAVSKESRAVAADFLPE